MSQSLKAPKAIALRAVAAATLYASKLKGPGATESGDAPARPRDEPSRPLAKPAPSLQA